MGYLCGTCRPYYSRSVFGLRPEEPVDDTLLSKESCPMRPILGTGLHDCPRVFDAKHPYDIKSLPDCGDKLFLDTGRRFAGYLWLRVPHDAINHPLRDITSWRTIEPDVRADSVLEKIQGWIKECDEHHDCFQKSPSTLPTRLLDVSPGEYGYVRLVESRSLAYTKYIALSHCWGTGRPLVLTRALYEQFLTEIEISGMPATFRDAIDLCRRLNVHYVWIDSLCIVQDDPQDWAREARTMATVYQEAYLTISASSSASDSDGFLRERSSTRLIATVSMIDKDGSSSNIALQIWDPSEEVYQEQDIVSGIGFVARDEPISLRAWTMQERFLSRRKLLFCRDQVFWECQKDTCSEEGLKFTTRDFVVDGLWSESGGYQEWYRLLSDYSQCHLTYETDALPALSGLVQQVSQRSPLARYCAGIWLDDISRTLAWSVHPEYLKIRGRSNPEGRNYRGLWFQSSGHTPKVSRTKCIQAPSFSWASWRGRIYYWYAFRDGKLNKVFRDRRDEYEHLKGKLFTYIRYVNHCLVPYPTADSLSGPFQDCWLHLQGCVLPVSSVRSLQSSSAMQRIEAPYNLTFMLKDDEIRTSGAFDTESRDHTDDLYVLPLHTDVYRDWTTHFLILERSKKMVDGRSIYCRVGVGAGTMRYKDIDRKIFQKVASEAALVSTVDEYEERRVFGRSWHDEEKMILSALCDSPQEDVILV